jgi:hypothetical protein
VFLFELNEDGVPTREINIGENMLFAPQRLTRGKPEPHPATKPSHRRIRTDPFDLEAIESNRITAEEFEIAWASRQYRVKDYQNSGRGFCSWPGKARISKRCSAKSGLVPTGH